MDRGEEGAMNLELLVPAIILAPCAVFGLAMLPGIWDREGGPSDAE
jgi:hypothetical protein